MSMESRRRKAWSEDSGVSEVVGNILILMITVILFSSIIAFVQQMPVPEQVTKADFSAGVTFWSNGTKADLTVTHAGGAVMLAKSTAVVVEIDGMSDVYNMSSPTEGLVDPSTGIRGTISWKTGLPWTTTLSGTTYTSRITVSILDKLKHSVIWTSQVTGGSGLNPPTILQRYVDSNYSTATPDPVKEWDNFTLYVVITDPDGDLDTSEASIWINANQIRDVYSGSYDGSFGNTYWWNFTGIWERRIDITQLDGKVIYIHAKDLQNHESVSTFVMTVTQIPTNVVVNPSELEEETAGGLPAYLTSFWKRRAGYGVYPEAHNATTGDPLGVADTNNPRTNFTMGEYVFVRFASIEISNVEGLNDVKLQDVRTGNYVDMLYNGTSTAADPFYRITVTSSASVFECQFKTSSLWPGAFTFYFWLAEEQDPGLPQDSYHDKIMITVDLSGSTISWVPSLTLFKDENFLYSWGSRLTPFTVSSGDSYKIYTCISVLNTDDPPAPSVAEIRITDMTGSSELFGVPPAGSMISQMYRKDSTTYWFWIDLRLNNGVQWAPGTNSYSLEITKFNDTNEGMYSLTKQIYIKGAGTRADFFVGTSGMASGNSNFNTREYAFYVQNNNLFSSRVLWLSESTPGSSTDFTVTAMASGDTDGDGDKDLLAAFGSTNQLLFFENTLDTFGTWQSGSSVPRTAPDSYAYRIVWIAFGDVNGDGKDDFAYANSNNQIVIFNTTYGSKGWVYSPPTGKGWTAPINKIALKDMTKDGRAELVVLANGKISFYDLRYCYDAYLFPERGKDGTELWNRSGGVTVDFDIADMNYDGYLDVVTADTTTRAWAGGSATSANVNYYGKAIGTRYDVDTTAPGYNPMLGAGNYTNATSNLVTKDNVPMVMFENKGVESPPLGYLNLTVKTVKLPKDPNLELRVYARIHGTEGGSPTESFYVWYSIDGTYFIPIITIDDFDGVYRWYNYSLPGSCMDKPIYIRFTDMSSDNSSAAVREKLEVDLLAVYSNLFGGFTGESVAYDATNTWKAVRAANIDGGLGARLEVVVARHHDTQSQNSGWKVYRHVSGSTWTVPAESFAPGVTYPTSSSLSFFYSCAVKEENGYYTNLAPTIFDAADINGDGYTDILVTNYTQSGTYNSYVGFFMNLWSPSTGMYWRYFGVKTWTIDPPVGQAKDPWVVVSTAANLNPPLA